MAGFSNRHLGFSSNSSWDSGALLGRIEEAFSSRHDDGNLGPFNFSKTEMELWFLHCFRSDVTPVYTV